MKPLSGAVVACILASLAGAAAVQAREADKVDDYVGNEMRAQHVPGLALGVVRDGKIVKARGYGLANVELNVPVKPESIFQTGSVGKQFTATAVMMLVEEGKIGLDDKVSKYFEDAPASWKDITVRNLLTHTSGIPDYESDELTKPGGLISLRLDYTEDELFKKIATLPLSFAPGEKWRYSNTGYVLLGILLHKVTGEFYGDFLQERIFKPLAMSSTRIISEADIVPNRSAGYRLPKGELKNQEWVSPTLNTTADGALYTNILDMAKWDAALYTEKLLKKASFNQMWTPVTLNQGKTYPYGFGWDVKEVRGHRLIEHGGAWQGFSTCIARYVDDKLTVVVLTNLDATYSHPSKVAHNVAGLYIPEVKPPELKPIEDKEPQVTAFLREVLEKIAAGKADPEAFAPDLRRELFPTGIQGAGELLKSFGPMKSLDLVERKQEEGQRAYTYRAVFNDATQFLRLRLSEDGKIAYLEPAPE